MMKKDTIVAIATGLTDSGIGIIRISGKDAVLVGDNLFRSPSGKKILKNAESHVFKYGFVVDVESNISCNEIENKDAVNVIDDLNVKSENWKNYVIDEVMAVTMRAPRSFTGEDTVEIQCHGGVLVMQKILKAALKCGARLAEPGEFTKRAFLNGRIDLVKAEAVMDVIHSQNEYALVSSVNQLKGALSEEVKLLRDEIIYEIAFIESALDDPEHISLDGYTEKLESKLSILSERIEKLIATAENGKLIKEGISTVIVGKPNAGKSSLLNYLVGEERAIVTDIAGTTRDVLQETVRLGDISLNVVDTAGIRNTEDTVEKIGVERAKKFAKDADLILYVVDASVELDKNDRDIIAFLEDKNVIILLNKSDLSNVVTEEKMLEMFDEILSEKRKPVMIKTSTKDGEGIHEFEQVVKDMFFEGQLKSNGEIVITNLRHKEALQEAFDSLQLVKRSVEDEMPEDFYSIDLMSAYAALGRIIGEEVDDDLVEEIFSKFCMGK